MNAPRACGGCREFDADPAAIEADIAGLGVLSSGFGATRAGDGRCRRHDRLLRATASCDAFAPRD